MQTLPQITALNSSSVAWVIFLACLVFVVPTTLAFYYHWGRYAPTHFGAIGTIVIYTLGLAVLLMGMLGIVVSL